jgi:hypothetical protein
VFRDFPELRPPKGKFRIMGIEKFEIPGERHWVVEDLDNCDEAIKKARAMTRYASKDATVDICLCCLFLVQMQICYNEFQMVKLDILKQ